MNFFYYEYKFKIIFFLFGGGGGGAGKSMNFFHKESKNPIFLGGGGRLGVARWG